MPSLAPAGTPGFFTAGNPATGIPATQLNVDWFNGVQTELSNLVTLSGGTLNKTNTTQLYNAVLAVVNTAVLVETNRATTAEATKAGLALNNNFTGTNAFAAINMSSNLISTAGLYGQVAEIRQTVSSGAAPTLYFSTTSGSPAYGYLQYSYGNQMVLGNLGPSGTAGASAALDTAGNFTASNRLRALSGAYNTGGDPQTASILSDFYLTYGGNDAAIYERLPNGRIIQTGNGNTASAGYGFTTFGTAFPTACSYVVISEAYPQGWYASGTNFPTIWATENLSAGSFKYVCCQWNGSAFPFAAGIAYRWLAIGY